MNTTEIYALKVHAERAVENPTRDNLKRLRMQMGIVAPQLDAALDKVIQQQVPEEPTPHHKEPPSISNGGLML